MYFGNNFEYKQLLQTRITVWRCPPIFCVRQEIQEDLPNFQLLTSYIKFANIINFIRSTVSMHQHFETDPSVLYSFGCLDINKLTRANDAIVRFVFRYSFRVKILVN